MENTVAIWICNKLLEKKIISDTYLEVYVYGFELILSFLISSSIIIAIGIITNQIIPTLTFLITFIFIRQFTGGFHANSYIMCKIYTLLCYIGSIFFSYLFPVNRFAFVILFVIGEAIIGLFRFISKCLYCWKHLLAMTREVYDYCVSSLTFCCKLLECGLNTIICCLAILQRGYLVSH